MSGSKHLEFLRKAIPITSSDANHNSLHKLILISLNLGSCETGLKKWNQIWMGCGNGPPVGIMDMGILL